MGERIPEAQMEELYQAIDQDQVQLAIQLWDKMDFSCMIRQFQCAELARHAASQNRVPLVIHFLSHCNAPLPHHLLDDTMMGAIQGNQWQLICTLLLAGGQMEVALHGAVFHQNKDLVQKLLHFKPTVKDINTALERASSDNQEEMIRLLIDYGMEHGMAIGLMNPFRFSIGRQNLSLLRYLMGIASKSPETYAKVKEYLPQFLTWSRRRETDVGKEMTTYLESLS